MRRRISTARRGTATSTTRRIAAVVAIVVTVVGAVGIAYAAIPDANGVIRACYSRNGGALRVSDTGSCRSTEIAISWNSVGPAGLTWRGEWAPGTSYAVRDAVQFQGSSYLAIFANQGSQPPSSNWMLLAAAGEKGDKGDTGATGPQGPAGAAGSAVQRTSQQSHTFKGQDFEHVMSVNLPQGFYALTARADLGIVRLDSNKWTAGCELRNGAATLGSAAIFRDKVVRDLESLTVLGAVSVSPEVGIATITLWCRNYSDTIYGALGASGADILAVKVGGTF